MKIPEILCGRFWRLYKYICETIGIPKLEFVAETVNILLCLNWGADLEKQIDHY